MSSRRSRNHSPFVPVERDPVITERLVDGKILYSVFNHSWRHLTTAIKDVKSKGFSSWTVDELPPETKQAIHPQSLPTLTEICSKIYSNLDRKLQNEMIQEHWGPEVWSSRLAEDGVILLPCERAVDEILTFKYARFVKALALENVRAQWITDHYVQQHGGETVLFEQFSKLRSLYLHQVEVPAGFLSKDNFPELVTLSATQCQFVGGARPSQELTPTTVRADTHGLQALIVSPGIHQTLPPKKLQANGLYKTKDVSIQAIRVCNAEDVRILRACLQIQHISTVWISPTTVEHDDETNPLGLGQTFVKRLTFDRVDHSLSHSLVTLSASKLKFLQIISPPGLTDSVGNMLVQMVETRNRINPWERPHISLSLRNALFSSSGFNQEVARVLQDPERPLGLKSLKFLHNFNPLQRKYFTSHHQAHLELSVLLESSLSSLETLDVTLVNKGGPFFRRGSGWKDSSFLPIKFGIFGSLQSSCLRMSNLTSLSLLVFAFEEGSKESPDLLH
ncbi:hypothetical protein T439DRAFT_383668, partial [Meredithblackwellia eburnea MCA 4105]